VGHVSHERYIVEKKLWAQGGERARENQRSERKKPTVDTMRTSAERKRSDTYMKTVNSNKKMLSRKKKKTKRRMKKKRSSSQ